MVTKNFRLCCRLKKCMFWTSLCIPELKHRPRGLVYVSSTVFRFHFNDLPFGEKMYSAPNANIESHLPLISLKFQNLLFTHNSLGNTSHVLSDTSRHFVRTRLQPVLHSSHQSFMLSRRFFAHNTYFKGNREISGDLQPYGGS